MKKQFILLLIATLSVTAMATGCGKSAKNADSAVASVSVSEENSVEIVENTVTSVEEVFEEIEGYSFDLTRGVVSVSKETNIRTEPHLKADKVGAIAAGEQIDFYGQCNENGWYRVKYNGQTCYMSNTYASIVSVDYPCSSEMGTGSVSNSTNIRIAPNLESEIIGKLAAKDSFSYTGICENGWYRVDYAGRVGYISNKYVVGAENGSAGSDTTASQPPAEIKTYAADGYVYIVRSGKNYHTTAECAGSMSYQTPLESAKAKGYEPCNKCCEEAEEK